ncbi:MAG TPA: hypothetical protein VMZ27_05155, partial [Candidatus Saccharimonadales bacterium]|nr:hypothetical protein [Candidatus Saccharimonadales bacterium]
VRGNRTLHFNNRLDAIVAGLFMLLVVAIVILSAWEWMLLLARKRLAKLQESEPVWLPAYALGENAPLKVFSVITLAFALLRELSGEAQLERAKQLDASCQCTSVSCRPLTLLGETTNNLKEREERTYVEVTEHRYKNINRCC